MIKYTFFKSYLSKATPLQRDIATKHFNSLWEQYSTQTETYRQLYQENKLSLSAYRQVTKREFVSLRSELAARLRLI